MTAKKDYPFKDVGERLRLLRGKTSQLDIAKALGITVRSYQRFELGERLPRVSMAVRIAQRYDVTVDWIFHGTSVKPPDWEEKFLAKDLPQHIIELEANLRAENRLISDEEREFLEWVHLFQALREQKTKDTAAGKKDNKFVEAIQEWIGQSWERASESEKVWLFVHFQKSFPEFANWLRDHRPELHEISLLRDAFPLKESALNKEEEKEVETFFEKYHRKATVQKKNKAAQEKE